MASLFFGRLMDFNYRRVAKKSGLRVDLKRGDDMRAFPLEKARIQIIWPAVLVGVVVILCYGWVMEREAHFAAPLVLFFLVGLSLTGAANVMITMCVDLYPSSPSTATAANNLVRCLLGAGGTAVIIQMIKAMGRGWCFTFVAAVVFLTSPMLWVITKWGPKWREERRTRAIKQQEEKEEKEATQWKCPEDTFSVPEKLQHADRKLRDMTNITPILAELLDQRNVHLRTDTGAHPAASIKDEFLKEAYSINTHTRSFAHYLRSIRRSYLSIAPTTPFRRSGLASARSSSAAAGAATTTDDLTNAQRDQIDAESKTILRSLHAKIAQLEEAEGLRQDTAVRVLLNRRAKRIGFGGRLGRWAAGEAGGGERRVGGGLSDLDEAERAEKARSDTTKAWREGVVWCLKKRLEAAGELQRGMMERRIEREVERGKSMLYKAKGTGLDTGVGRQEWVREGGAAGEAAMRDEEEKKGVEAELSAEQLQLFKEENDSMLKHYEDTLDQVRTAELSMLEISELQTTLVANLETQSANIVQMVEDAVNTTENVTGGNRELKRATERESTARIMFFASCGLCAFLITWDLVF
ncbi:MAG: hypothetical protein LQ342_005142 [Letrouitia transgressa]|nr:MAG: hypothetical protein LQ342_005142 [Letrouitia transgressa]